MDIATKDRGADIEVTDRLVPRRAGHAGERAGWQSPRHQHKDRARARDPEPNRTGLRSRVLGSSDWRSGRSASSAAPAEIARSLARLVFVPRDRSPSRGPSRTRVPTNRWSVRLPAIAWHEPDGLCGRRQAQRADRRARVDEPDLVLALRLSPRRWVPPAAMS